MAMGVAYPELNDQREKITREVDIEEDRFANTLDTGLSLLSDAIKQLRLQRKDILSGEVAFKLYDTYGFPIDLTQDILREDGFTVDVAGFERLMEEQRERGRAARKDDVDRARNHARCGSEIAIRR